jgi:hypothetical protein
VLSRGSAKGLNEEDVAEYFKPPEVVVKIMDLSDEPPIKFTKWMSQISPSTTANKNL